MDKNSAGKMDWTIDANRWPGPDRQKWDLYDEVVPSPDGKYAAVLYSCGEISLCVFVGLLTLLEGPHDNPTVVLQPRDFLCYSMPSQSVQWLNGSRYFVVTAYIRRRFRNWIDPAFTFVDTEKRTFAHYKITLELVGRRFAEVDNAWVIPADNDNSRHVPALTISPDGLTWQPWVNLGRKTLFNGR